MGKKSTVVPSDEFRKAAMKKIALEEGFRPKIYLDTAGIPTVGYGFRVNNGSVSQFLAPEVRTGRKPLDQASADAILYDAIPATYNEARNSVGPDIFDTLSPDRQLVLTDMGHQMGGAGLAGFKKMRESLAKGDYDAAAREMLNSKWAKKDSPNRAIRNATLMRGPTRAAAMSR